jgi:glucose-1-phosphate adenylyltransferase
MNVQDMIVFHGAKKADLSIAAIPVPLHEANQFGIIQVDEDWRITGFQEKPEKPTPIPGNPDMALASMGNYIFTSGILLDALQKDSSALGSSHDFGKNILPSLLANGNRLYAYDFRRNRIPGSNYEYNDSYWRDVGNLDSFYEASMDLRAVQPQLDLYNQEWPIRGAPNTYPPAKFVHNADGRVGHALQSIVCEGTIISGATVTDSVIGRRCRINSFSEVHQCVLNDGVEVARGARLRRCIIDKGAKIPANDVIGYNPEEDKKRFMMTESGIIVIAKDQIIHTV